MEENDPVLEGRRPAPILYVCFAKGHFHVSYGANVPEALRHRIHSFDDLSTVTTDLPGAEVMARFEAFAGSSPVELRLEGGPAFYVPESSVAVGDAVRITSSNRESLRPHFLHTYSHLEELSPCAATLVGGVGVATCRTVRKNEGAAEAGVDTIDEYRRQGHGSSAVSKWAELTWELGIIPCYSTGWSNAASLGLAQRMGMIQYANDYEVYVIEQSGCA